MVKGGLQEDDLLQVLGFLMMDIFRSVSNFQVGLHFWWHGKVGEGGNV